MRKTIPIFPKLAPTRVSRATAAFTLVEMLAVLVVMGILFALVVPAILSSSKANRLTIGEQMVTAQFNLARQVALSDNTTAQVRFYSYPGEAGDPKAFRALQVFKLKSNGTMAAVNAVQKLPNSVVLMNSTSELDPVAPLLTDPSPLLKNAKTTVVGDPKIPGYLAGQYNIATLDFRSDGSTTLDNNLKWHVTLVSTPVPAALPANFATVQLDPLNGTTRSFRP